MVEHGRGIEDFSKSFVPHIWKDEVPVYSDEKGYEIKRWRGDGQVLVLDISS